MSKLKYLFKPVRFDSSEDVAPLFEDLAFGLDGDFRSEGPEFENIFCAPAAAKQFRSISDVDN